MDAFLFYIDDWLSSKKVQMMDAHEERGYLRLLMYAAKEPDCGLPDDDNQLAVISLLSHQWNRVTREALKRSHDPETKAFRTSGQKLRECFFNRKGRLYNKRLMEEFMHQKEVSEARAKAGKIGNTVRARAKAAANAFANASANASGLPSENGTFPSANASQTPQQTLRKKSATQAQTINPTETAAADAPPLSLPEWQETAWAVRAYFPDADDEFVMKLVAKSCEKVLSTKGARGDVTDAAVAYAVGKCWRSNQRSAGLFLETVPQFLATYAVTEA